jgi:hypothetical protein
MKTEKDRGVIREFFIDDAGLNRIICHNFDKRVVLYLKLQSETRKRKVGVITKSTKTIKITRTREKHLFNKMYAYGFNEYILREAKLFDTVWLKDNYEEWKVPVKFILETGQNYLHFKQQGFDLQRFVTLEELEQFRVLNKEKRRF